MENESVDNDELNENDIKFYKKLVVQNKILVILIVFTIIITAFPFAYKLYIKIELKNKQNVVLDTYDINNFNSQFTIYEGEQTGYRVKLLCEDLISSGDKYRKYPFQPPILINKYLLGGSRSVSLDKQDMYYYSLIHEYKKNINDIKDSEIDSDEVYIVKLEYGDNRLVKYVIIEPKVKLSYQDIYEFNDQFNFYSGKQTGARLKKLCEDLISSLDKYRKYPFQPPTVIINDKDGAIHKVYYSEEESKDEIYDDELIKNYNDKIDYIKNNLLINRHTYTIDFECSKWELINKIIINY